MDNIIDKRISTKKQNSIRRILDEVRDKGYSPQEVRYLFKKVRELGKYQVKGSSRRLPDFLNDAEIDVFLNKSLEMDKSTRMLVYLGIFTGLRVQEMSNLLIEDVDFSGRQLKVVLGKGGKDRYVPMTTNLMLQIKAYVGDRKKGYLLAKSNQTQYSVRALQKKIEKLVELCGINKKVHTHTLRHTFATLLLRRGMSLERIQLLMGHSSRKTTEIYAHLELAPVKEQFIQLIGME